MELDSRLSLYMSSLLWVDDSHLGVTLLSLLFSIICYFHQIVMISVIKLCRVVGLADLHGVNVLVIILGFQVFSLNVAILTRFSVLLGCLNFFF